jgi:hypothetical protein
MIFTSNHVKVLKQFNGDAISSVYIDIVTQGGHVGNDFVEASDLLKLQPGEKGVFFAYQNTFGLLDPANGQLLYDVWASSQGFFRYDVASNSANAPFVRYPSIEQDLYPELINIIGHPFTGISTQPGKNTHKETKATASITSFSPTTVRAGAIDDATNNLLTINGSGFGASPSGSCAVFFDLADDGSGGSYTGVPYNDVSVVSWSDIQIKVRVPTGAGTGLFFVTNSSGTNIATSSSNLIVEFAVQSASFTLGSPALPYVKEYNLMNTNGAGGYTIQYSNSTLGSGTDFSSSTAKVTFQRALNTWKTLIGFNVTESATATSLQTVNAGDGVNVVQYDNTNTGTGVLAAGVLAVCYYGGSICSFYPSTTEGYQKIGFDITVRSSASSGSVTFTTGPCAPTTSEYDLETVILHELGHAIGLGHINDPTEGAGPAYPAWNPAKLMNYAVTNGMKRVSPDYSAFIGGQYLCTVGYGSHTYPTGCSLYTSEMTPLTTTVDAHDECPATFPSVATSLSTVVSFDLSTATSNKYTDPQYTAITGTGTGITNTVFYPIRTNSSGGFVRVTVSGYTTTPASVSSSCATQGVELALYQVSSCPTGQSYPTSGVLYRTITANGALPDFTGLTPNSNYLMVMDGKNNTFASYSLAFTGSTALPIDIISFSGNALPFTNNLDWSLQTTESIQAIVIERSIDGKNFDNLATLTGQQINVNGTYQDGGTLPQTAYYRLRITGVEGDISYSRFVKLSRNSNGNIFVADAGSGHNPELIVVADAQEHIHIKLGDVSGKVLWSSNVEVNEGHNTIPLNIPQLAQGLYFISVDNAAGKRIYSTRFVR